MINKNYCLKQTEAVFSFGRPGNKNERQVHKKVHKTEQDINATHAKISPTQRTTCITCFFNLNSLHRWTSVQGRPSKSGSRLITISKAGYDSPSVPINYQQAVIGTFITRITNEHSLVHCHKYFNKQYVSVELIFYARIVR